MEQKFRRYCREARNLYKEDSPVSSSAVGLRKKLLKMALELESSEEDISSLLSNFWTLAYYEPLRGMRVAKEESAKKECDTVALIFCGELITMLAKTRTNGAFYNCCIGDLHRYISNETQRQLATTYYRKAIEVDPEHGNAYNQLALMKSNNADDFLPKLRLILQSVQCEKAFSQKNLDQLLDKFTPTDDELVAILSEFVHCAIFDYSRTELDDIGTEWYNKIKESTWLQNKNYIPLVMSIACLTTTACLKLQDDAFVSALMNVTDVALLLLKPDINPNLDEDDDEEDLILTKRRVRRNLKVEAGDDEDPEEESPEQVNREKKLTSSYLLLATMCEWICAVDGTFEKLKSGNASVPFEATKSWEELLQRVAEQLTKVRLPIAQIGDDCDEEMSWIIDGPTDSGLTPATRKLAYWCEQLCSQPSSPIEKFWFNETDLMDFDDDNKSSFAFRIRHKKQSKKTDEKEHFKAMMKAFKELEADDSHAWHPPVYAVFDYESLVTNPLVAAKIFKLSVVICVIPSFVFQKLDKMKNSGHEVRMVIREIQKAQTNGQIRMIKSSSHSECVKVLLESTKAYRKGDDNVESHKLVSLVVENQEDLEAEDLVEDVDIYKAEDLKERLYSSRHRR